MHVTVDSGGLADSFFDVLGLNHLSGDYSELLQTSTCHCSQHSRSRVVPEPYTVIKMREYEPTT